MRIFALLPALLLAAALPAQTPSPAPAPVPAAQGSHHWTLHERSTWANSQAPQFPLTSTQWPSGPDTTLVLEPLSATCPLTMRVRRLTSEQSLLRTHEGRRGDTPSARLRLSLQPPDPTQAAHEIVEAKIVVHGTNGRNHVLGLRDSAGAGYQISRTLAVSLGPGAPSEAAGEVQLPGFTSTDWVELQEVTLANHQTWSFPQRACRVQPDPLMLITER